MATRMPLMVRTAVQMLCRRATTRLAPLKPRSLVEASGTASGDGSEFGFGTMGRIRVAQRRKEGPIRFVPGCVHPSKGTSARDLKTGSWRTLTFCPTNQRPVRGGPGPAEKIFISRGGNFLVTFGAGPCSKCAEQGKFHPCLHFETTRGVYSASTPQRGHQ